MATQIRTIPASLRSRERQRRLDPMRGIFVSLGLGAVGWLLIVAVALGVRAVLS